MIFSSNPSPLGVILFSRKILAELTFKSDKTIFGATKNRKVLSSDFFPSQKVKWQMERDMIFKLDHLKLKTYLSLVVFLLFIANTCYLKGAPFQESDTTRAINEGREAPKVAVQEGEKKGGSGKKVLLIVGGLLVLGGILYLAPKTSDADEGRWSIYRHHFGSTTTVILANSSRIDRAVDAWNEIQIEARGEEFKVYINGH
jgi:hypothetical protein